MSGVDPELLALFRDEAEASLGAVLERVGRWPEAQSDELVPRLHEAFRALHNVKGAARMLGLEAVEEATHALEDALHACRDAAQRPDAALDGALAEAVGLVARAAAGEDCDASLSALARRLRAEGPPAPVETSDKSEKRPSQQPSPHAPSPMAAAAGPNETQTVETQTVKASARHDEEPAAAPVDVPSTRDDHAVLRISAARVDGLVAVSADALAVAQLQTDLQRDLDALAEAAREAPLAAAAQLETLAQRGAQGLRALRRTLENMNAAVRSLGMQPLHEAVPRWRITVHETAQAVGREVTLDADVGDTEVDRRVLQALQAPLTHILRNAVDHGIEPPEEREAKGKPRAGRVLVRAEAMGSRVRVEVSDDGRGVDPLAVARHAVERGVVDAATAASLKGPEAAALLFLPGLSTATRVTRTSGRGVGLDVVATTVRSLGGDVSFAREPTLGGATVVLDVPASMVSTHALLVSAGGQTYALPVSRVARVERALPDAVARIQGFPALVRDGAPPVPLAWLSGWTPAAPDGSTRRLEDADKALAVVVLGLAGRDTGLVVDAVLGDADVVIRPLPWNLRRVPGVAGAAVLGDGTVTPWLVPEAVMTSLGRGNTLASSATGEGEAAGDREVRPSRVLLVDDSVTSRTLISQILRGAGYDVRTATDGAQAWAMLDAPEGAEGEPVETWDALVSDVEMPNMDGLELTRRVRVHGRWAHLPVVLVTSRGDGDDLQRGADAGADEYVVKGRFDRDTLLAALRRHIPPRHA